jgi:hypothetical protein
MRVAMEDLKLDQLHIVYPGAESYPVEGRVRVTSILDIETVFHKLQEVRNARGDPNR